MFGFIRDASKTFLLTELGKGLMLTLKYFFAPKITVQFPEEKNTSKLEVSRSSCVEALSKWRGALYCLQIVRGSMSCFGYYD